MTHQRVSFGEDPCFGHEAELGKPVRRRRKSLRFRLDIVALLCALPIIAIVGAYVYLHTSGMLSNAGLAAFLAAGVIFLGFFADPVVKTVNQRLRRRKIRLVK